MKERFSPHMYVDYIIKHRGISVDDIGVASIVILSWVQNVIRSFAETVNAQRSPNWFYDEDHVVYDLFTGEYCGKKISFALAPEGAPATVMMMEEMIACGAQCIIGLGWAGSLQSVAPIGSMVLPTNCISEEGTSLHYLNNGNAYLPDMGLVEALQYAANIEGAKVNLGVQWTTDAPYRELLNKIDFFQQQGVLGVDMETSAMFALGRFRGIKVCNLLVVSDELWGEWNPAFRSPELKEATELAQRIILRILRDNSMDSF